MIIGGFRFVTSGDSSRHGDVSLEDAVLEPLPPPLPLPYTELVFSPGDGITCGIAFITFGRSFEPLALTETIAVIVVVNVVAVEVPTFSLADVDGTMSSENLYKLA